MKNRSSLLILFLSCLLFSCRQVNVYEKSTPIPGYRWTKTFAATGTFSITDTSALYNIYIVLRHLDSYNYNNIWLNTGLAGPGDSLYFQKLNLTLGSDATGWEGSGMNDIWEVRKLLNSRLKFTKNGKYRFSINHIMRDDPLPGIMSVGLRVEKSDTLKIRDTDTDIAAF